MTTASLPAPSPAAPRPGRLRRLGWLWVLLAGALAYLLVLRTLVATENLNFVPSLILLGSIVVPASVLVFAASSGRQVLVPPGLIALVAVLGGVVGTVAAGTLEYDALHRLGALPMIMVGLIEESAKLVVPLVVLLVTRYRDPRAGVIVGVASGMGFATLETMGYGFNALLRSGSLVSVEQTLLLRALLSPAGHVAWTGLTVAALWAVASDPRKGRAVARLVGVFVAAVLLHAAWDGLDNLWVHLVVGGGSFAALLVVIHRAHRGPKPA
ncbi:PrsW family intramembrane metalloprotease [Microlunatus capsulatus]|uniref:RsiW-degrading membrane proteinase PrsW (M82 family) n=1 Tax=Microlunatus capsulatus TaxID=99117 RepID=A0ABS4Z4H1_9ACTN|nr:PrsW family intramembrane metalloprotease [Microlunatus capsulatus]MBP2415894.1 RsiW-degrading membrane proteinase PrsW (M82 family) [Microlunatus capsulatus]